MKKVERIIILMLFLSLLSSTFLFSSERSASDERSEPVDLIIGLDKSLSMEGKLDEAKQWINDSIIGELLIPGDYLLIVTFYGRTETAVAGEFKGEESKALFIDKVNQIQADGRFTDIGAAFDRLRDELIERQADNRKKIFFFVSDLINEPPRTSHYFTSSYNPRTRDRKLSHEYLDKLEVHLDKIAWKVLYLNIGDNLEELKKKLEKVEPVGYMEVDKSVLKSLLISNEGQGHLNLSVLSQRYQLPQLLVIENVKVTTPDFTLENIMTGRVEQEIPENGTTQLSIPVSIPKHFKKGVYDANLTFGFGSTEHFEQELPVKLHLKTIWEDLPWLIPLIVIGAILFILLVVFIVRQIIQGTALSFRLVVEEMPLPRGRDTFKVMGGKNLFLIESMDLIRITERLSSRCIAKLYARGTDLKMAVLKEESFKDLKKVPDSLFGHTLLISTDAGRKYHVKFEEV